MHRTKISVGPRLWLLAAIAGVIAVVGLLPLFGSTAYAAGLNYDATAAFARFVIPGGPVTSTTAGVVGNPATPFNLAVTTTVNPVTLVDSFPASGQILVSTGDALKTGAEIMTYDSKTATSFHITQRGNVKIPGSAKKDHASGSRVHLATVLTAEIPAPTSGPKNDTNAATGGAIATLNTKIAPTTGGCSLVSGTIYTCPNPLTTPFLITLNNTGNFSPTGIITISHQTTMTPNVGPNQPRGSEYMGYDTTGVGANQLRIIRRALQPDGRAYGHPANGFPEPAGGTAGRSHVSLHFQAGVKSNANFFPTGTIMVCNPTNPLSNCELLGYNNTPAVDWPSRPKVKPGDPVTQPLTQFHIDGRCGAAATFNKSCTKDGSPAPDIHTIAHPMNSIVISPDTYVVCRLRMNQPGVDTDLGTPGFQEPPTQVPGTSVGVGAVCYTRTQPKVPPKPGGVLDQPVIGSTLIVINSIAGQPFLSTGCFTHVALGVVPCFDTNGTTDGTLAMGSPCIPDFTPGTNLLATLSLTVDKSFATDDVGTITVVTDTIHDTTPGNADDCDDPASEATVTFQIYDDPGSAEDAADDTDNDGCLDVREAHYLRTQGGLRDPWNPYDYYDINHDGAVNVVTDILQVAAAFGPGDPDYAPRKDRGSLNYGPFGWNKSAPNGSVDVVNDILGVATQFGDPCPHNHALYVGPKAPWYGAGVVPGH